VGHIGGGHGDGAHSEDEEFLQEAEADEHWARRSGSIAMTC